MNCPSAPLLSPLGNPYLSKSKSSVSPNLGQLTKDESVRRAARDAYTIAVDRALIYSFLAACLANPIVLCNGEQQCGKLG